jgi:hypothetical protein
LIADYINHHPGCILLSRTSVMALMQWSYRQTLNPSPTNLVHKD